MTTFAVNQTKFFSSTPTPRGSQMLTEASNLQSGVETYTFGRKFLE